MGKARSATSTASMVFDGVADGAAQNSKHQVSVDGVLSTGLRKTTSQQRAETSGAAAHNTIFPMGIPSNSQGGRLHGGAMDDDELAAAAVLWGKEGEQGRVLFGRSDGGWSSGVVDLGRVMGLVLARRESSVSWLLAGAGARSAIEGGSAMGRSSLLKFWAPSRELQQWGARLLGFSPWTAEGGTMVICYCAKERGESTQGGGGAMGRGSTMGGRKSAAPGTEKEEGCA
jgi:hypothetical protein